MVSDPQMSFNACYFFSGFFNHTLPQYEACRKNFPEEHLSALLIIACQEKNGHIRERVVREWETHKDPMAVSFLIERLSDWVPQVRAAAWNSLRQYMTPEYLQYFLAQFYWIDQLLGKGNPDTVRYGEELIAFVLSQDFSEEVAYYFQNAGLRNWRMYVKHSTRGPLKTNPFLFDLVRNDP